MSNVGTAAAGKTLIGGGVGASPRFASIGTNSGLTAHGTVIAEGNGAFVATSPGTTGQVLTSNGASADPTFQAVSASGAVITLTGNTGGAVSPSAGNINVITSNATVKFSGSTPTLTQDFGLSNLVLGSSLPSLTSGSSNTGIGNSVLHALTSGINNTAVGLNSLFSVNTGIENTGIGTGSLGACSSGNDNTGVGFNALSALTSGINNVSVGSAALQAITTGNYNVAIGVSAGGNYTTSESSNIIISNIGTASESNTTRIGTQGSGSGQQNRCFIAGITGVTASSAQLVTINSSTGQLGVTSIAPVVSAWTDEAISFNASSGNGYFSSAAVTATLPASPSQGDTISFCADSASALTIRANTGQLIRLGTTVSASAGTCASNSIGDSITLVYRSTGTTWHAISSVGTWTIT